MLILKQIIIVVIITVVAVVIVGLIIITKSSRRYQIYFISSVILSYFDELYRWSTCRSYNTAIYCDGSASRATGRPITVTGHPETSVMRHSERHGFAAERRRRLYRCDNSLRSCCCSATFINVGNDPHCVIGMLGEGMKKILGVHYQTAIRCVCCLTCFAVTL